MSKLSFRVVSFSSEDEDHPASQLNVVNPSTKGWHSVRWSTYPQELGFELINGSAHMTQIQILSHQSKISSKIEIFVGEGPTYDSATFKRLGYLSLDSNERSNYNARELKTVFVDYVGKFLKLLINENHANKLNIYNQVGIIAVSVLGDEVEQEAKSVSKHVPRGPGAGAKSNPYNDLSVDLILDPHTANKLRQLADAKNKAVEVEDYVTAKAIKAVELELKNAGAKLAQIDMNKAAAVAEEDYDLAREYKEQADEMRKEIQRRIDEIEIPGVKLPRAQVPAKAPPKVKSLGDYYSNNADNRGDDSYSPSAGIGNDEIPVGGGGGSQFKIDGSIPTIVNNKRVAKVEAHHDEAYDDDMGGAGGHHPDDPRYASIREDPDAHLDAMSRPIRPKSNVYAPIEGDIDDDPMGYNANQASAAPALQFPPGQHPLQGIEECEKFDIPNEFPGKSKEIAETGGIVALIGEYRARCLWSKNWQVREAALNKVIMMFQQDLVRDPGITGCINALCVIIRVGVEDKIQQVLLAAIALMEEVLKAARSAKLARSVVAPLFEPILVQLMDKINDGNARIREIARKGLDVVAGSPVVGPSVIANHCYRPLPAKLKTAWRPLQARIALLADLVAAFGLNNNHGLSHESMLNYTKTNGAYAHSNAEVRDAAKSLVVNIHKILGAAVTDPVLSELRSKQQEEYRLAFSGGGGAAVAAAGPSGAAAVGASVKASSKSGGESHRTDKQLQHATHSPGGKVQTSATKANNSKNGYENSSSSSSNKQGGGGGESKGGDGNDFTTCMFCSMHNPQWTENDLDVHFWKDCPLLISCPSCAQIVEIAGLPEHQLDECDAKDSYVPCEVTGLAIRATEIAAWKASSNCKPAPKNCMYCPLCLSSVEDSDEAWVRHLTSGCPRNTRTNGSS